MSAARSLLEPLVRRFPPGFESWQGQGRQAGVLVALTNEDEPRVVLGRRGRHLPLHPGEVAFPGGKREVQDRGPWDTALRESEEEVALPRGQVLPQAQLSPLVTRTRYTIYPCVGLIPAGQALQADPREFDSLLLPRLALFARPELFRLVPMAVEGGYRMVPHYQVGDDEIWGVTATVLARLVNVVYDAGLDLQSDYQESS